MKLINPIIKSISEILNEFSNFIVHIPFYQRKYEWNYPQLDTLFFDLENFNDVHFFGTITTRRINSKDNEMDTLRIIDGQQRITTSIIFLCATRKVLSERKIELPDKNKLILANLSSTFNNTFNNDFVTLKKIFNDEEIQERNTYSDNFKYIYKKLDDIKDNNKIILTLNNFLNKFKLCELCFSDYATSDEMVIFTSINSKGKILQIFDLFKSSLLLFCNSDLLETNEDKLIDLFNQKFNNVNQIEFEKFIESLYHYYSGKEIKGEPNEKNRAILENLKYIVKQNLGVNDNVNFDEFNKILKFIYDFYKLFLSVKNNKYDNQLSFPDISFITKMIPDAKKTPIYPLVYLFFEFNRTNSFNDKKFETKNLILSKFIKSILPLVNHFILFGQGDSRITRDYFEKICENRKNIVDDIEKIIPSLENISMIINSIPTKNNLIEYKKNNWAIKFLLSLIDWFPNGTFKCGENIKFWNVNNVHLEHIMPQKLTDEWKEYLIKNNENVDYSNVINEHQDKLNMIGNFLLLSQNLNSSISNDIFINKKDIYSSYSTHSLLFNNVFNKKIDIYEKNVWDFKAIIDRTIAISEFICKIFDTI